MPTWLRTSHPYPVSVLFFMSFRCSFREDASLPLGCWDSSSWPVQEHFVWKGFCHNLPINSCSMNLEVFYRINLCSSFTHGEGKSFRSYRSRTLILWIQCSALLSTQSPNVRSAWFFLRQQKKIPEGLMQSTKSYLLTLRCSWTQQNVNQ